MAKSQHTSALSVTVFYAMTDITCCLRNEVDVSEVPRSWNAGLFTALHAMPVRTSYEKCVCPSVCLSNACIV